MLCPLCRVKPEVIERLAEACPDRQLVRYVVDGFHDGFKLGMMSCPLPHGPCKNLSKVLQNPAAAQQLVDEEVTWGQILGPFDKEPFKNMVYSPINLVPKPNGKFRLIHDLSHPWDGKTSVNACIPVRNSKVKYHYINEVIRLALELGTSMTGSHMDVNSAFRNLPVNEQDLPVLAFTLNGKIYINTTVPFGAASSCKIFKQVAMLIEWIVKYHTDCQHMSHYLDDFPLLRHSYDDSLLFMEQFRMILDEIGLLLSERKMIGPCVILEYLGMLLDFLNQCMGIQMEKRKHCLLLVEEIIRAYRTHSSVTIKKIEKAAGHLNFICHAIPMGCTYLSTLYTVIAPQYPEQVVKSGHHRRNSREIHNDMMMYRDFLQEMNPEQNRMVPFLWVLNIDNDKIRLFADSAGSRDLGFGCWFGDHWAAGRWCDTTLFNDNFSPNIALLELFAIVTAFEIWAPQLSSKTITLHSDNQATVHMLLNKRAEIPAAMNLLCHLTKTCMCFQIFVKVEYIPGCQNTLSDSLSQNQFQHFRQLLPSADHHPAPLPRSLWPPQWTV